MRETVGTHKAGMVWDFHTAYKLPIGTGRWHDKDLLRLRLELVFEEFKELLEACGYGLDLDVNGHLGLRDEGIAPDPVKALDALGDLEYVEEGFALAFGMNLTEAFRRIHVSNMSKLGEDGKPIYREDGKVLKGPNFKPPILEDLVDVNAVETMEEFKARTRGESR